MVTREMINFVNEFFLHRANRARPLATGGFNSSGPTQADKPSPKSSYTTAELRRRLYRAFPSAQGHRVSGIANTNSMEPFLDDSDVVVLASLQGDWRARRLEKEPFAPGQIVIYRSSVGNIIHTLKSKTTFLGRPAWYIQGHNNFLPDMAKILETQIVERCINISFGRRRREGD